jgi:hypothetical protein
MTTATLSNKAIFAEIRAALGDLAQAVQKLAGSYKKGYDADPSGWREAIEAEFPTVPSRFWDAIERVAAGLLLPDIVARGCVGLHLFGKMSIPDQKRVLERGFAVWTGGADHRMVPAHLIDLKTLNRVLDRAGRVIGVEEQAAFARAQDEMDAKRRKEWEATLKTVEPEEPEDVPLKWRAARGHVYILQCPVQLSAKELRIMLADLEGSRAG